MLLLICHHFKCYWVWVLCCKWYSLIVYFIYELCDCRRVSNILILFLQEDFNILIGNDLHAILALKFFFFTLQYLCKVVIHGHFIILLLALQILRIYYRLTITNFLSLFEIWSHQNAWSLLFRLFLGSLTIFFNVLWLRINQDKWWLHSWTQTS